MEEVFLKYLSFEKVCSKHTIKAYKRDIYQFSDFIENHFEIQDHKYVTRPHVRDWIMELMDSGVSPISINRKMAALKSFYKFLIGRQFIESNPTLQISPLKTKKVLPVFLKEKEIIHLLDKIEFSNDFYSQRDKLILELLYSTGIRLAELQSLNDIDVNLYNNTIRVLGKRNKERIIPIGNSLKQLIIDYQKLKNKIKSNENKLLLTDTGSPLYPMFVYRKVKKYLNVVTTLSKTSPHVMRHTFATHLLNKGADLNAVKDLLGHTSLAATQVYTHNSIEKLKTVFDQAHPKA